jgi:hypothetical protein
MIISVSQFALVNTELAFGVDPGDAMYHPLLLQAIPAVFLSNNCDESLLFENEPLDQDASNGAFAPGAYPNSDVLFIALIVALYVVVPRLWA